MSEIYTMAGHLIRRLNQISVSVFADRMNREGFDLTQVQYAALTCIRDNPGIDQATLAGLIAYDRVTIGGVVDRLVQKGLVKRGVSKQDRRAKVLHVTSEANEMLERLTPIVVDLQDDILTGLEAEERAIFTDMLAKITTAGNPLSRAPLKCRES